VTRVWNWYELPAFNPLNASQRPMTHVPSFNVVNQIGAARPIADAVRTCANWVPMRGKARRVLVADDDRDVRVLLRALLERAGHDVVEAADGRECLRAFYTRRPEIVLLDVAMPGLDGWTTLERIREVADVPVIMLTARGEELDRVRGLRAGADDYIAKPFGRQELLARVEAVLRRTASQAEVSPGYIDDFLEVDFAQHEVTAAGHPVRLTPLEFRLLAAFVQHPDHVLSPDRLRELVWGDTDAASRDEVKLYVGYLRRKLREAVGGEPPVETLRGFGYRYISGRRRRSGA
jgi:DNA-binding response OmpR family regulator